MKILVTGATGFIGRYVVAELLARGHEVVAVARSRQRAMEMSWYGQVEFIACDLHDPTLDPVATLGIPDVMVHLAWSGLPHYKELFHFEQNLPMDYRFIKSMILGGLSQVLVTGTCLEYGMKNGCLSEDEPTQPVTCYAIAKDTLRRFLQELQLKQPFVLQWVRLFYNYGENQHLGSLLSQLKTAIRQEEQEVFNMSGGEQLRDFLAIETIADYLCRIALQKEIAGVINCCSGTPRSVRSFVEQYIAMCNVKIKLNLGYYPYPDYEPMAFWGDRRRLNAILGQT